MTLRTRPLLRSGPRSATSSPEPFPNTSPFGARLIAAEEKNLQRASFHSLPATAATSQVATPFAPKNIVEFKDFRCLIADCPKEETLELYVADFKSCNVTTVVRACEPTYAATFLTHSGIAVHDLPFSDGGIPSNAVIKEWLRIISEHACLVRLGKEAAENSDDSSSSSPSSSSPSHSPLPCLAVHCVAGMGRAPVLVTLALIELGMEALDAVELIRKCRKGAINSKQIGWLAEYKKIGIPKLENGCGGEDYIKHKRNSSVTSTGAGGGAGGKGFGAKVGKWFGKRRTSPSPPVKA